MVVALPITLRHDVVDRRATALIPVATMDWQMKRQARGR